MKMILFSMACVLGMIGPAWADNQECKNGSGQYCINVAVENVNKEEAAKQDFCFVLQLNGSERLASGSIPLSQLPTALFTISNDRASIGKPLSFKIIKAQVAPTGECNIKQASLQTVTGCDIFEFATMPGVSRSMMLIESSGGYTCKIKN